MQGSGGDARAFARLVGNLKIGKLKNTRANVDAAIGERVVYARHVEMCAKRSRFFTLEIKFLKRSVQTHAPRCAAVKVGKDMSDIGFEKLQRCLLALNVEVKAFLREAHKSKHVRIAHAVFHDVRVEVDASLLLAPAAQDVRRAHIARVEMEVFDLNLGVQLRIFQVAVHNGASCGLSRKFNGVEIHQSEDVRHVNLAQPRHDGVVLAFAQLTADCQPLVVVFQAQVVYLHRLALHNHEPRSDVPYGVADGEEGRIYFRRNFCLVRCAS